jgi:hypothetical protein
MLYAHWNFNEFEKKRRKRNGNNPLHECQKHRYRKETDLNAVDIISMKGMHHIKLQD